MTEPLKAGDRVFVDCDDTDESRGICKHFTGEGIVMSVDDASTLRINVKPVTKWKCAQWKRHKAHLLKEDWYVNPSDCRKMEVNA